MPEEAILLQKISGIIYEIDLVLSFFQKSTHLEKEDFELIFPEGL
ncbi:hypothetical protein DFQ04_2559 [Algoriphagus boseongensis]|uniref:Uncharacterized protein n=1 Tax=Algoriphagus boseongensis TaxID=1442587 RepID=A0A4R6T720_9BACT|nr:hypothetical protein DFQ04_2559 [Algoriphagus boseongensis]